MTDFSALFTLAQAGGNDGGGSMNFLLFIVIIFLAFYFIILRPQKREQQQREKAISQISKGTKVITAGGIHGTVWNSNAKETLELEIAKGVRITINRSSVAVVDPDKPKEEKKDQGGAVKK